MDARHMPGMLALAAAAVATITDLRRQRIYNWLTLPLLILGPLFQFQGHGVAGLRSSLLGAGLVAGVLVTLAILTGPGLGGGDIKLLVALGAVLGWPAAGWMMIYTALSGLVVALPVVIWRRSLWSAWRNLAINLLRRQAGERDIGVGSGSRGPRLPYAVCIMLGTLAAVIRGH